MYNLFLHCYSILNLFVEALPSSPFEDASALMIFISTHFNELNDVQKAIVDIVLGKQFCFCLLAHVFSFYYQVNFFKCGHFQHVLKSTQDFSISKPLFSISLYEQYVSDFNFPFVQVTNCGETGSTFFCRHFDVSKAVSPHSPY